MCVCVCVCVWEGLHLPCGTGDDGILVLETASGGSHCKFKLSGMIFLGIEMLKWDTKEIGKRRS
jgi:hypothetical protein